MSKLTFTPSQLADLATCPFRYCVRNVRGLDLPESFSHKMLMGSFVHAMEAAYDLSGAPLKALAKEVKVARASSWYHVNYSRAVTLLEEEAKRLFSGGTWQDAKGKISTSIGYPEWSEKFFGSSKVIAVEERVFADVGPVILAPKFDLILETHGWFPPSEGIDYWVVERKTTERWDDKGWENRWTMNGQTTIQLLAAEAHWGVPFTGVMVEPIQIARQQRVDQPDPQPIRAAERLPLKWVRKPRTILAAMMGWLESIAHELEGRQVWHQSGMANGSCDRCSLRELCKGNLTEDLLQPRSYTLEIEKERKR